MVFFLIFGVIVMYACWERKDKRAPSKGQRIAQKIVAPVTLLAPLGGPGSSSFEHAHAERRHQEMLAAVRERGSRPPWHPRA